MAVHPSSKPVPSMWLLYSVIMRRSRGTLPEPLLVAGKQILPPPAFNSEYLREDMPAPLLQVKPVISAVTWDGPPAEKTVLLEAANSTGDGCLVKGEVPGKGVLKDALPPGEEMKDRELTGRPERLSLALRTLLWLRCRREMSAPRGMSEGWVMENVSEGREARGIMVAIAIGVKATTSGRAPS